MAYIRNPYTQSVLDAMQALELKHVFVRRGKLLQLADEFAQMELAHNDWHAPVFPQVDDDTFTSFIVVGNALNYCFTDFTTHQNFDVENPEGEPWTGAFAMWASLKRAMDEGMDILNPEFLAHLSPPGVADIFRSVKTPIPMIDSRWEQLVSLGRTARRLGIKNFADIFKEADSYAFNDGKGVVERLVNDFPCYRDENQWRGHLLQFHKRAQLAAMMYHGRAVSSNGALEPLRDPGNIGPIADYQVPKALRSKRVIRYSKDLAGKVDRRVEIPGHGDMENEIRGIGVVWVMDELIGEINSRRLPEDQIVMGQLDFPVWKMGGGSGAKHHYTKTTDY